MAMRILLFLLVLVPGAALAQQGDKAARVDRLMEVSGLSQALGSAAAQLYQRPQRPPGASDEEFSKFTAQFKAAADATFQPEALGAEVRDRLVEALADEEIAFVTEFYASEFGARVVAMENAAQEPAASAEIADNSAHITDVMSKMPGRAALVDRIDKLIGSAESRRAFLRNAGYAMVVGMVGSGQIPQALPDDAILAVVDRMLPAAFEQAEATRMARFYYAYAKLDDEELARYLAMLEDPRALHVYAVLIPTLQDIYTVHFRAFGEDFLRRMGRRGA